MLNPEAIIFIEQIAPAKMKPGTTKLNKHVMVLNHKIKQLVNTHPELENNLVLVDMYTDWKDSYFADHIHYNVMGAAEVAKRYYASLSERLDKNGFYNILALGDSRVSGKRPQQ